MHIPADVLNDTNLDPDLTEEMLGLLTSTVSDIKQQMPCKLVQTTPQVTKNPLFHPNKLHHAQIPHPINSQVFLIICRLHLTNLTPF